MLALAGAALWLAICASFVVSAAIIGMPPQTIVYTVAVSSLNFAAIVGAISVLVLLRTQPRNRADESY